jgi:hypothetical protein
MSFVMFADIIVSVFSSLGCFEDLSLVKDVRVDFKQNFETSHPSSAATTRENVSPFSN